MQEPIHIVRMGQELGVLDREDALELLRAGFLRSTDEFWTDDYLERRSLTALLDMPPAAEGSILKRARAGAAAASKVIATTTHGLRRSVGATHKLAVAAQKKALEDYLPYMREQVVPALASSSRTAQMALKDDEFLHKLFGAMYDCLPKPVTRFVTETVFIEFCFKHRRRLLE
jgi:hypothetical protein